MKIEQVLAELKKERRKINEAIAALERIARDSGKGRRRRSSRSERSASRRSVAPSKSDARKPKNAKIIQFAAPARRANSN
jgi:hypothetical protein